MLRVLPVAVVAVVVVIGDVVQTGAVAVLRRLVAHVVLVTPLFLVRVHHQVGLPPKLLPRGPLVRSPVHLPLLMLLIIRPPLRFAQAR